MMNVATMKQLGVKAGLAWISLSYAPALFAESGWFPRVSQAEDMTKDGNSAMKVLSNLVKQGLMILLFTVSAVMFVKFINIISHGIEEAKKNEGGSLAVFANYAAMGIMYLTMSLVTGYLGYNVITNFKL